MLKPTCSSPLNSSSTGLPLCRSLSLVPGAQRGPPLAATASPCPCPHPRPTSSRCSSFLSPASIGFRRGGHGRSGGGGGGSTPGVHRALGRSPATSTHQICASIHPASSRPRPCDVVTPSVPPDHAASALPHDRDGAAASAST